MGSSIGGSLNKPSNIIRFDSINNTIKPATILAKKRNGDIIGKIQYTNLNFSFVGKGLDELSFEVHKKVGRNTCKFWTQLHGLVIIDYVGYGQFEATFTTNVSDETIKNCTAVSLETELAQYTLHQEAHFNDEQAITSPLKIDLDTNGKYIPVMVCDADNPDHSVVHRILQDKAPHWSIGHIPSWFNVNGIVYEPKHYQRTFEFEDSTIYDAFQTIQEECNCLVTFNTYERKIDLWNIEECVFEKSTCKVVENAYYIDGVFYDSNDIPFEDQSLYGFADGIGDDTSIIVSQKELANDFTVEEDKDSLKNCFYVKGGDDVVNDMVAAANVSGNNYIYMFDNFQYDDMPTSLVQKIQSYQSLSNTLADAFYHVGGVYIYNSTCSYDEKTGTCRNANLKILTDAIYRNGRVYVLDNLAYCKDGKCYDKDNNALSNDDYIYTDDAGLYVKSYQNAERLDYIKNSKFPDTNLSETSAESEFNNISSAFSKVENTVIIQNSCTTEAYSHVTSTVETMINTICDSRYDISMLSGDDYPSRCTAMDDSVTSGEWTGYIRVQNNADETDVYTGELSVPIKKIKYDDIDKSKEYLEQRFKIALAKLSIADLDYSNKIDSEFNELLSKYNLDSLKSYYNAFNSCLSTLDSLKPQSDEIADVVSDTYTTMRTRYQEYAKLTNNIIEKIQKEVDELETTQKDLNDQITKFRQQLDLKSYLGDDYIIFRSYVREDEYSNSNYVSDGLNSIQQLDLAKELIEVAKKELGNACVLQHKVSCNLNNIFALPRYKKLFDDFAIFNYIRAKIDGGIYKLRIVQIDYNESEPQSLNVTFSDTVTYTDGTISDLQSMKQAVNSMSTSFSATTLQAKQGASAMSKFNQMYQEGIISADYVVKNSTNEEVVMDNTGIICKSESDIGAYGLHQCRLLGNGLYLTDDAWSTPPKAAIGLMKINGVWTYGMIANQIVGEMIASKTLTIGDENENVVIDQDGITLDGTAIRWKKKLQTSSVDGLDDKLAEQLKKAEQGIDDAANAAELAKSATERADSAEKNAKAYAGSQDAILSSTLKDAYEKYSNSKVKALDDQVSDYLGLGGTTLVDDKYMISPYLGGGYLNIADGNKRVIVDPKNLGNTGYIFQVHNNDEISVGIKADGTTLINADIYAKSLTLSKGIQIGVDYISGLSTVATSGKYSDLSNTPDLTVYATTNAVTKQLEGYATTGALDAYLKTNDLNTKLGDLHVSYRGDVSTSQTVDSTTGLITTTNKYTDSNGESHTYTTYTYSDSDYVLLNRENKWGDGSVGGDGKNLVKISKDGLLTANNAVIYGTIYATDGEFSGKVIATSGSFTGTIYATDGEFRGSLKGASGTFSGDLSSDEIYLNKDSSINRGLISLSSIKLDNEPYQIVSFQNAYASNSDKLGIIFSFANTNAEQYSATAAFGVYKKNGSLFVQSHANFYAMGGLYFDNNKKAGFLTTTSDTLYSVGHMGINGSPYSDIAFTVNGDARIDGFVKVANNLTVLNSGKGICFDTPSKTLRSSGTNGQNVAFYDDAYGKFLLDIRSDAIEAKQTLYSPNGTVSKSDKNLKHDISSLDIYKCYQFINSLIPSSYKYNDGTSDRYHHGFIAQDVKEVMGEDDWGVYVDTSISSNSEEGYKALRYEEIIADLVGAVQYQQQEINNLKKQINGEA